MSKSKYMQIAFLVVGTLTALEFIFVRGMFTWLIAVAAVLIIGVINVIANLTQKQILNALMYILCTVAICMGYIMIAANVI